MEKNEKIYDKNRSGRPKKLSSLDKKAIKKNIYRKMGSSVRKITNVLNGSKRNIKNDKKFCHGTVQNYLKTTEWGKNTFKSSLKPKLSSKNRKDRLDFGKFLQENAYLTSGTRGRKLSAEPTNINI